MKFAILLYIETVYKIKVKVFKYIQSKCIVTYRWTKKERQREDDRLALQKFFTLFKNNK